MNAWVNNIKNTFETSSPIILVRGGGDLASGVILRLHHAGFCVIVAELAEPHSVRRLVSFSDAVLSGEHHIEDVTGKLAHNIKEAIQIIEDKQVAVLVYPHLRILSSLNPSAIIDARMLKSDPLEAFTDTTMLIGLGPGFEAGVNCHAVIETNRGPTLGRVLWHGCAQDDTRVPEQVSGYTTERVLRAPVAGVLQAITNLGDILEEGELVATVDGQPLIAPFKGALRGLVQSGLRVTRDMKIGDIDPRCNPQLCSMVSEKALAIGGGVLEALLSNPQIRNQLGCSHEPV